MLRSPQPAMEWEADAAGTSCAVDDDEPFIQTAECRICQEEDSLKNLETPCACSGSLKFAHRKCVQHWCNEKGDIICEICHQPYQPGYSAPPRPHDEQTAIDISGGWTISGTLDFHDPRLFAIAEAECQILETEYDDYAASNASGAAFCRSAALILIALLLLRHALTVPDADGENDVSNFFTISVALLYYGLGCQHIAASQAKAGSSTCRYTGCFCGTIEAASRSALYDSSCTCCDSTGNCLIDVQPQKFSHFILQRSRKVLPYQ